MAASGQSVQVIPDQRPHRAGADAPVQPGRAGPRRAQPAHQRRVGADQGAQRVGAGIFNHYLLCAAAAEGGPQGQQQHDHEQRQAPQRVFHAPSTDTTASMQVA